MTTDAIIANVACDLEYQLKQQGFEVETDLGINRTSSYVFVCGYAIDDDGDIEAQWVKIRISDHPSRGGHNYHPHTYSIDVQYNGSIKSLNVNAIVGQVNEIFVMHNLTKSEDN